MVIKSWSVDIFNFGTMLKKKLLKTSATARSIFSEAILYWLSWETTFWDKCYQCHCHVFYQFHLLHLKIYFWDVTCSWFLWYFFFYFFIYERCLVYSNKQLFRGACPWIASSSVALILLRKGRGEGGGGRQKGQPIRFSSVTSTNVKIKDKIFWLWVLIFLPHWCKILRWYLAPVP